MSAFHTSFYKGSKVRLIFNDGHQVIGKFVEKLSNKLLRVQLASGDRRDVKIADLRSANYFKPFAHERL